MSIRRSMRTIETYIYRRQMDVHRRWLCLFKDQIPLDFLAALDFWSLPRYSELRLLSTSRCCWRPGSAAQVVWEEAPPSAPDTWLRIRTRRRWADETDSDEELGKVVGSVTDASESRPGGV